MWYACLVDVRFAGASRSEGRLRTFFRRSQQQLPEFEHGSAVKRGERPQRPIPSGSRYNLGQFVPLSSLGLRCFRGFSNHIPLERPTNSYNTRIDRLANFQIFFFFLYRCQITLNLVFLLYKSSQVGLRFVPDLIR